ncbi:MAG: polyprenol monophosphomannose synthase [Sediminibacterium sp.]|nr:polyprenol monophosphomannose synthase [Sediminibacterium sp.]MBP6144039.1 polyprenol monophosphomannose synthase [Sediminibacterium sp.]
MKKIVIIPTYNEKENIAAIIQAVIVLGNQYHVLVVDDGSPDGTAAIVKDLMLAHPDKIFIQERTGKLGLGTAYIHGFKWALANQYDYIFEMDADFSHNPLDLDRLLAACENGADVAIGSRYVKGGATENWPLDRLIYSKGGSLYTRIITGMPVKDPTAGFMCYKNKVLAAIQLDNIKFIGYAFQIEMKFASWRLGFKLKEVPITFIDRKIGVSKMSKGIIKEAIMGVLNMQWQSFTGRFIKHIKREQL